MSVIEVRICTIQPGRREELVRLYDEVLLPAQRRFGLDVLGQFIALDDQETFVWLRRLASEAERHRKWEESYGSDLWRQELGPRANPLIKDSSNVIAVAPTPGCVLGSVDFAEIEQLQATGAWDQAAAVLAKAARHVQAGGADLLLLCTNTMHKVADRVQAAVDIPLLHLADTTADAVLTAGLETVGLLGTAFTMEQASNRDRLAARGLTVLIPDADDRAAVHSIIYQELCQGIVLDASRDRYRQVMARLADAGPTASSWAAPRSSCSSPRPTASCHCSRPPGCTPKPPSSTRSPTPTRPTLATATTAAQRLALDRPACDRGT